jgi:hypothetical protein
MIDYAAILVSEHPGKAFRLDGDSYDGLTWLDDSPKPSKASLDSKWAAVELARNIKAVQQARRARYFDETDDLFWEAMRTDGKLTAWKAAVAKIKTDLPKPGAAK